ncbi:PLP-dependent aminotransferase family protein [Actinosynnema sp. CS-041913]|uniref:MocR-like pyridoxine biosynthesis transcription factor PdxR n=1 Tax=Actinosynnema sp. CS-041913 TaxID=3239917 RepID=UPI003D8CDC9B
MDHSGADFLQLRPAAAPAKGLTSWLTDAVRTAISDGRLGAGARLPATRLLADELGVSRGVVVEAYRRLADEGLVSARTGVGTVVTPPGPAGRAAAGLATPAVDAVGPLLPLARSAELDLSPGVPDLAAFPRAAWLRAERAVLTRTGAADLGYGDPRGLPWLRAELAARLARVRGVRADPDDIIVVAGVAQSLALLAHLLHRRGTVAIAVEEPGSRGARDELVHWGLTPTPVPVDGLGLRVDELARTGLDTVLLTPAHQFPTGVVMAPRRRRELLDWAADGLVIEDDYDAEYRYDRAPVPAIQASAPDRVAYTGSVSKTLAPGMRLGWLIPPRDLHADLVAAKHASDLGSPALPQLVLAQLIASGELDRHIRLVRTRHRARRDALLAGLARHLPAVEVQGAAAGLHLLITFADDLDDTDLADRIRAAGVRVHPLSWHRQRPGPPGLVLGYAAHSPGQLHEAARRIGEVVRR